MHGGHLLSGGIGAGMAGNFWCHRTGRPTACVFLRKIPAPILGTALGAAVSVFLDHLYGGKP